MTNFALGLTLPPPPLPNEVEESSVDGQIAEEGALAKSFQNALSDIKNPKIPKTASTKILEAESHQHKTEDKTEDKTEVKTADKTADIRSISYSHSGTVPPSVKLRASPQLVNSSHDIQMTEDEMMNILASAIPKSSGLMKYFSQAIVTTQSIVEEFMNSFCRFVVKLIKEDKDVFNMSRDDFLKIAQDKNMLEYCVLSIIRNPKCRNDLINHCAVALKELHSPTPYDETLEGPDGKKLRLKRASAIDQFSLIIYDQNGNTIEEKTDIKNEVGKRLMFAMELQKATQRVQDFTDELNEKKEDASLQDDSSSKHDGHICHDHQHHHVEEKEKKNLSDEKNVN